MSSTRQMNEHIRSNLQSAHKQLVVFDKTLTDAAQRAQYVTASRHAIFRTLHKTETEMVAKK